MDRLVVRDFRNRGLLPGRGRTGTCLGQPAKLQSRTDCISRLNVKIVVDSSG